MFIRCNLLFLLLNAVTRTGQVQFTSSYKGSNVTALIGSTVNFTWGFTKGFGAISGVSWGLANSGLNDFINNGILVSLNGSGNLKSVIVPAKYSGRVTGRMVGNQFSGQAIFSLTSLRQSDSTFYGCNLFPESDFETKQFDFVRLVLEGPPSIIQISGNQTVTVGNNLSLQCKANATPRATITWTRLSDNSVVTMPLTISRQSEGGYRCTADNRIPKAATADVFITVQYKPSGITIRTSAARNTAIQGQNVTLTCHVTEAKPLVLEYKFYRNNTFVASATKANKLILHDVKRSQHFGEYKCEAHNSAGNGESGAVVLSIYVPAEIQSLTGNVTVNEGSAIELRCNVTGYPSPTVTWKKDEQQKTSVNGVFFIASSTRILDSGAYVCIADNVVQTAEKETFVTVRYKPTITSAEPATTKSWIGEIVSLTCVADGLPTPTITWKKEDGSKVKETTNKQNIASVEMKTEGDFGTYTCEAKNVVGPAAAQTVEINQIKAPGPPIITSTAADIQATSLTVKWNAPTTSGGSPITAYRVVILRGGKVIRNENFTDLNLPKEKLIGSLNISTNYTVRVYARNFVFEGKAGEKMIRTKFEGVPAAAEILSLPKETKNTKITLRWSEPENNGKPIKNYTVYQRTMKEDGTPRAWNRISVITDLSDRQVTVLLEKGKIYEFVVAATNEFGESLKEEKKIKKLTVVGGVPSAVKLKVEQKDDKITMTWEKPDSNGAAITKYSVYHRVANTKEWEELIEIPAGSPLQYVFQGEKGKEYKFVVTASNRYGESPKADIKSFKVSADESTPPGPPASRIGTAVIAGAGAAGALLILGLILLIVWWKRRKTSSDHGSSVADLHGPNPDDFDDGYHTVGAASAARQLQTSGPPGDVTYAEVDKTQKKDKRPVTDVYAEVDKSKKTKKKPKKQPGELDYAELGDLRPNFRPAPQPSGATAKPLVRAPAYEGTEYADITQFGIPQPEPTYDNVPKKDVVYSNVESM